MPNGSTTWLCATLALVCLVACDDPGTSEGTPTVTPDVVTTQDTGGAPDVTATPDSLTPPDTGTTPLAPTQCSLWPHSLQDWPDTPYPEDCLTLSGVERYRCGEYWFWQGLSHDISMRATSMERLGAVISAEASHADAEVKGLARMHALRGQLGLALLVEHGDFTALELTQSDMQKVAQLDPENPTIPTFLDSIELIFAFRSNDEVRMAELWDEIWGNVESCPLGNLLSISGTSIGLPLETGWPTETVNRLRDWECTGAGFCGTNTWKAPFVRPGLAFHFAEAFARVGDIDEATRFLDGAIAAEGFSSWPYATFVQNTRNDVAGWVADFATLGPEGDATNMVYANQEFGCVFCHSTNPPQELIRVERLGVADLEPDPPVVDPDPDPDPNPDPDPPPTGDGACTNDADTAIIMASSDIGSTMSGCAFECFSGGEDCVDTCIINATGLSESCTVCFADMVDCTMSNCALNCLDPEGAACTQCQETHCIPPFTECAGMSPP